MEHNSQKSYPEFKDDILRMVRDLFENGRSPFISEPFENENGESISITIKKEGGISAMYSIPLRKYYEQYLEGCGIKTVADAIGQSFGLVEPEKVESMVEDMKSFEKIKEKLFVRLLSAEKVGGADAPFILRVTGDIAEVVYVLVDDSDNTLISSKLPRDILDVWRMDEKEVMETALCNTYFLYPPRIFNWERMLFDLDEGGINFMDPAHEPSIDVSPAGVCVTTEKKTNGAVSVFLPGVADRLASLMDDDLILAFTSVHEVMVHAALGVDSHMLRSVLVDTIRETTPPSDFLTDHLYIYRRKERVFEMLT